MADEDNQATPFIRTNALSTYPEKSNPDLQPMDQPLQYPANHHYPQAQQSYPPQYQPAPGMAPYPQPQYPPAPAMASYPPPQYFASPPQQQQQQSSHVVVIGGQPAHVFYQQRSYPDFTGLIVFSCIVICCCGSWICGGIAFILAMFGQSSAPSGDEKSARQLRNCSCGLSIAGVVTAVIILIINLAVTLNNSFCSYGYHYDYNNNKVCCPYYESSIDKCGSYGYYYSGGIEICCQFE